MRYISILLLLVSTASHAVADHNAKHLNMVISNWAPYKGEDLPDYGIAADISKKVFTRAGYELAVSSVPWKRALSGTIDGTYCLTPAIWLTPERAKELSFTKPILQSRLVVISLKTYNFHYKTLQDLKGETVGIGRGWAYPKAFMEADYFKREEATDLKTNINKLLHKRFNVIVAEAYAARHLLHTDFREQAGLFHFSKVALQESPLHVAISKKVNEHEIITKKFNQALKAMQQDGSFNAILKSHGIQSAN